MRAQISIEFLIIMSLAIVMLLVFLTIGAHQLQEGAREARQARVLDIAQVIQQELATAVSVRDGYGRSFMLPQQIESQPYFITQANVSNETQLVTVAFRNTLYNVRAPRCVGSIVRGNNTLRTEAGVVYCNS